jgi:hypothetical protein
VSHLPERTEKICLNCGADVQGRFCHVCGQENIEPKESFWHLVTHFVYDITHFDGKFFSTLRYLLFKPGFLSHEYLRGRRASYLHPIRMYVFTSAIFFLIFFSMRKEEEAVKVNEKKDNAAAIIENLEERKQELQEKLADSSLPAVAKSPLQKALALTDSDLVHMRKDTLAKDHLLSSRRSGSVFGIGERNLHYGSIAEYDSLQKLLPEKNRDNFIERKLVRQNLHLKEKYKDDGKAIWTAILEKFRHMFPQMLFVSLPLFALLLQLLYIRRKKYFYVNHVVFTIHLYCATFIIILLGMLLNQIVVTLAGSSTDWIGIVFFLTGGFYWYKALRGFYEQRRFKTIMKYILIMFLSMFIMAFLFVLFFFFSAMSI